MEEEKKNLRLKEGERLGGRGRKGRMREEMSEYVVWGEIIISLFENRIRMQENIVSCHYVKQIACLNLATQINGIATTHAKCRLSI